MKILKISVKFAILAAFCLLQKIKSELNIFYLDTLATYRNIGIIIVFGFT